MSLTSSCGVLVSEGWSEAWQLSSR